MWGFDFLHVERSRRPCWKLWCFLCYSFKHVSSSRSLLSFLLTLGLVNQFKSPFLHYHFFFWIIVFLAWLKVLRTDIEMNQNLKKSQQVKRNRHLSCTTVLTGDMIGQAEYNLMLLMTQVVSGPMNKQTVSSISASCHSVAQLVHNNLWDCTKSATHTHTQTHTVSAVHPSSSSKLLNMYYILFWF